MSYTNSSLISYTKLSPNHSGERTHSIDRITPHCVVGQCAIETLGNLFAATSCQASSNYGIGFDGRVGMFVEEKNRSWCSSSNDNDQRAVTIECASDTTAPYAFYDVVYQSLINLCVDICKRNGKTKLLWLGDKDKTLAYEPKSNEMVLTVHRWFANKSCPGDWLYNRLGDLADKVTSKLGGSSDTSDDTDDGTIYRVQTGAFSQKANAEAQLEKLKEAGFDGFITTGTVQKPDNTPNDPVLTVGDKVKLDSDATVYGTSMKFSSWIYDSTLYVREISGDRVVISTQKTGDITGAVDKKYLNKI